MCHWLELNDYYYIVALYKQLLNRRLLQPMQRSFPHFADLLNVPADSMTDWNLRMSSHFLSNKTDVKHTLSCIHYPGVEYGVLSCTHHSFFVASRFHSQNYFICNPLWAYVCLSPPPLSLSISLSNPLSPLSLSILYCVNCCRLQCQLCH